MRQLLTHECTRLKTIVVCLLCCCVFRGGREGYSTLLNTDAKRELDHMAAFFRMAIEHKKAIGFKGQLLIEPKPKEPTKHQYDYDAQTVISFLKTYSLDKDFKLNIEVK